MMPGHLKAERIWRLALAAMSRDSKLTEATPQSILLATMQCAALGLKVEREFSFPFPRPVGRLFVYNQFEAVARIPA